MIITFELMRILSCSLGWDAGASQVTPLPPHPSMSSSFLDSSSKLIYGPGPGCSKPSRANLVFNCNLVSSFLLFKSLFRIIFSILFRTSNHQIVDKNDQNECSFKAFRSETPALNNAALDRERQCR